MKRYNFALAVALAGMAIFYAPALASAAPVIVSAVPSPSNQVTITGSGFGSTAPTVKIDTAPAPVVSHSSTTVVVSLPAGITSGTFQLTLTNSTGSCVFYLTLGDVGPQGPPGPQGEAGPAGTSVGYNAYNLGTVYLDSSVLLASTPSLSTSGIYYISGSLPSTCRRETRSPAPSIA
jgi:hypothetical protein